MLKRKMKGKSRNQIEGECATKKPRIHRNLIGRLDPAIQKCAGNTEILPASSIAKSRRLSSVHQRRAPDARRA